MLVVHNPHTPLGLHQPLAIAIGTFDGYHRGHAEVVRRLIEAAKERNCLPALLTYDNHPTHVLQPQNPTPLISTLSHKLALLENTDVDYLLLFTFDPTFAAQTAEQFLQRLMQIAPFTYLNMGYDGRIGKQRTGDREHLTALSEKHGFDLEYTPTLRFNDETVSSTAIRSAIASGNISLASDLLGRPYSIAGHVKSGHGRGEKIGFPTANIPTAGLVTPTLGVWAVQVVINGEIYPAVANLGHAPTFHTNREVILEVHIPNFTHDLYGKMVEVIFCNYLRSEKRFENIDALKTQLAKDVADSLSCLT